jgi:hypothetical protein
MVQHNQLQVLDFQPDWFGLKIEDAGEHHVLTDAVRGVNKNLIQTKTNAELTLTTGGLTSFDSDGFTLGADQLKLMVVELTYVSWNWLANGAGVSNTDGSITSTVSANTTSGFSIVKLYWYWKLHGTIGHGLGVAPKMIIKK